MEILNTVRQAEKLIRPYVLKTPLEYSPWLKNEIGVDVWLKLEHVQTTGSFKLRGACNFLLNLKAEQRQRGVITASTGNHGAAVAYIAQKLKIDCEVFLPKTVNPSKVALMELYGAKLSYHGQDSVESEEEARRVASQSQKVFISPYNDPLVITGQATLGLELGEQLPHLDAVFVPVGGGGLVSGVASYLKSLKPEIEVVGCQPLNSPVMYESIKAGKIIEMPLIDTLSDGTAGGVEEESLTFDYCREFVDKWETVQEEEIADALLFLARRHYWMVEGAAGLALACLRKTYKHYVGKNVALILCGRKMGLDKFVSLNQ
ncbi:MAG: threonine/serine dehydratase [Bacteroidia bacterium]|nr:threonine/serine dehydratase [Bacteroidia bacterium]